VTLDQDRRAALVDIMAMADPPELPARGHRWTQKGDPYRYGQISRLSTTYALSRLVAREDAERRVM
jgi:hypothetical protein